MRTQKACGIIIEYNPMHNGHIYHLKSTHNLTCPDHIIAVMSGNFVQRGQPAILDKFARTKAAILCGVDMVIELPAVYSTASAEAFAYAACYLLDATNIVDSICFGSEHGNINELLTLAHLLINESEHYKLALKKHLKTGVSFPSARMLSIKEIYPKIADIIKQPNNILAIEYLKAINSQKLNLKPFTITRTGGSHNADKILKGYASAKTIRHHISQHKDIFKLLPYMPKASFNELSNACNNLSINTLDNYSDILHYILKSTKKEDLKAISGISEGMEGRIIYAAKNLYSITDILDLAKTKRYTYTALSRAVLHIILSIKKSEALEKPQYIRVLGVKKEKRELLSKLNNNACLPVIINPKDIAKLPKKAQNQIQKELYASEIYNLGLKPNKQKETSELSEPLIVV